MSAGDDKPATEERESPAWGNTTKGIVASAVLVLFGLVVWRFQFVITPLALAAVLAYLLNPPIRWLAAKTAISRAQAVLIVYALILGYVVFGDVPDAWSLAGIVLIVGSGLFTLYREQRLKKRLGFGRRLVR